MNVFHANEERVARDLVEGWGPYGSAGWAGLQANERSEWPAVGRARGAGATTNGVRSPDITNHLRMFTRRPVVT